MSRLAASNKGILVGTAHTQVSFPGTNEPCVPYTRLAFIRTRVGTAGTDISRSESRAAPNTVGLRCYGCRVHRHRLLCINDRHGFDQTTLALEMLHRCYISS